MTTKNKKHPSGTTHTRDGDSYKVGTIVECFDHGEWVSCDNAWEVDDWLEELTPVNPEDVDALPFEQYKTKEVVKHEWVFNYESLDAFIDHFESEFEEASFIKDVALTSFNEDKNVMYKATYTEEK